MATTKNTAKKTAEAVKDETSRFAQLGDNARDYVANAACSAKERADSVYANAEGYNKDLESAMNRAIRGYVSILDGVARVSHDNVVGALNTVEKVAKAQTFTEAAQIQVDFVRDSAAANYETARTAFEVARDTVTEGVEQARDRATAMWPAANKAA
ncbi:MAG: phasin family protein [Pseudomonadota bacterium]